MNEVMMRSEKLIRFCEDVFKKSLPENEARIVAESLVDADLRGVSSHGVQRVSGYLRRMEDGLIKRQTKTSLIKDTYTTALINANNGWGQVASIEAMELAIDKAQNYGTAFVGVRDSNHFGTASYYTRMAAEKGFIGIAMTNASPIMVPFGAKEPSLGPNPLSISIPTSEGKDPIILDMSTSNVARGKIMVAKKNGDKIPEGWAITKDGKPTTDPNEAWEGYVLPIGPKGSGLAIIIDILCGILTGSLFGKEIPMQYDDPYPQRLGHFFGAINVESFAVLEDFYTNVNKKVDETTNSEPSEGFDQVNMPGEIEMYCKKTREKEGIPISNEIYKELKETGKKYGVEISDYL